MSISLVGITSILSSVVSPITEWVKGRQELKKIELEGEKLIKQTTLEARVNRIKSSDDAAGELDVISMQDRTWKDEYLLLLTTLPVLILFAAPIYECIFLADAYVSGDMTTAVLSGFVALQSTPEYYWWALGVLYIDTFGLRRMLRLLIEGFVKKKFGSLI